MTHIMRIDEFLNNNNGRDNKFVDGLVDVIKAEGDNYVYDDDGHTLSFIADEIADTIYTNLYDILPGIGNRPANYPYLLKGLNKVLSKYGDFYNFDVFADKVGRYIWEYYF